MDLSRILAAAITPVALVSGVGLLLLSLTQRLGRTTDRVRLLVADLRAGAAEAPGERARAQIRVLYSRARILRLAITGAAASMGCASLLVLTLFGVTAAGLPLERLALALFGLSLVALIVSILMLLADVRQSLLALREELRGIL